MCMQGGWEAVVLPVFYLCMGSLHASVSWSMREFLTGVRSYVELVSV